MRTYKAQYNTCAHFEVTTPREATETTKSRKTNENDYFSARTLINRRSLFFISLFYYAPQHNSPVLDGDRVAHAPLNKAIIIITIEQINRTYIPF